MDTQDNHNRQMVAYFGALMRIMIEKGIAKPEEIKRYHAQILRNVDEHMTQQHDEAIIEWARNNPVGSEFLKKIQDAIQDALEEDQDGDVGGGPATGC